MAYYGIRDLANDWFKSYLTERKQFVRLNNIDSRTENISIGVPQGSVLGPLLFSIYVNDMPNCLKFSEANLFADDTLT